MKNTNGERKKIGQSPFSVSARVAMQLGRESISNSIIAILELVKNSYDADAENIVIRFKDIDGFTPSLLIQDDGIGMTLEQITDNWMVIGTNNKAINRASQEKNRVLVGEKGLGRLGLDRLSHIVKIQTFSSASDYGVELEIDWQKYENSPNKRLEEIRHDIYQTPKVTNNLFTEKLEPTERGTRIELFGLKDIWNRDNLKELHDELSLLLSPFGSIDNFSIWFETGNSSCKELNGRIETSQMAEAAAWTLESQISGDGHIIHNLRNFRGAEFNFDGTWQNIFRNKSVLEIPRCGPVTFKMFFFDRKDVDLTTGEVRRFLAANQGVRIYRDGFRVKPYGDPSGQGDWLSLALRRVQNPKGVTQEGVWYVGYNQIVGAAFLKRDVNDALLDQTNREGIVEGPAYYDLRRYTLHAIEYFEEQRQKYERSQKQRREIDIAREDAKQNTEAMLDVTQKVKEQWKELEHIVQNARLGTDVTENLKQARSNLSETLQELEIRAAESIIKQKELIKESEEQEQEYEDRKNTLGNLASLGILAAAFGHETVGNAKEVIANINLLKDDVMQLFPVLLRQEDHSVLHDIDNIDQAARRINTFATFTLDNVRRDKRKRQDISIKYLVSDVFKALNLKEIYNITPELTFENNVPKIAAFSIDWESIFINLITNSKWAIDNSRNVDNPRIIRVKIFTKEQALNIAFADSGYGIPHHILNRIFEPGFSTKSNDKGDVIGTGMGLSIVKSFVESYGGMIHVEPECDLGGAEFIIEIPIPQVKK